MREGSLPHPLVLVYHRPVVLVKLLLLPTLDPTPEILAVLLGPFAMPSPALPKIFVTMAAAPPRRAEGDSHPHGSGPTIRIVLQLLKDVQELLQD